MAAGAVFSDSMSVLVKPEVAQAQMDKEKENRDKINGGSGGSGSDGGGVIISPPPPINKEYRRFYGKVIVVDPSRTGTEGGRIAEEVISHFTSKIGTKVKVSIHIDVEMEDGADDNLIRTVSENCKTLNFENFEFEE